MRRKSAKPYWEMTTDELREATKEFDEEFVADKAQPLTPRMQAEWERAKRKHIMAKNGSSEKTIVVRLEKSLINLCSALARRNVSAVTLLSLEGSRRF
jgi:hypothetical protein